MLSRSSFVNSTRPLLYTIFSPLPSLSILADCSFPRKKTPPDTIRTCSLHTSVIYPCHKARRYSIRHPVECNLPVRMTDFLFSPYVCVRMTDFLFSPYVCNLSVSQSTTLLHPPSFILKFACWARPGGHCTNLSFLALAWCSTFHLIMELIVQCSLREAATSARYLEPSLSVVQYRHDGLGFHPRFGENNMRYRPRLCRPLLDDQTA